MTSYANHTGAVRWSRPTGTVPQAWQADGGELYMAVAAGGYLASAPVTALRRINLRTGAQHLVRPHGPAFLGALSLAYQGVVVFSSARWARGYSATTGRELWHYPSALPDMVDAVAGRLYLISGNTLIGVNPQTGSTLARVSAASSSGLYGVREGALLGIDHGALGKAWGYGIAAQQVLWTSRRCPGRTTSWTCPASGEAHRRARTRCCSRSAARWPPGRQGPPCRGAPAPSLPWSTADPASRQPPGPGGPRGA